MLLESWNTDLPPGTIIAMLTHDKDIHLQIPKKPEPIVLPLPPTFKKFARRPKIANRKLLPPPKATTAPGTRTPNDLQRDQRTTSEAGIWSENDSWEYDEHSLPSEFSFVSDDQEGVRGGAVLENAHHRK